MNQLKTGDDIYDVNKYTDEELYNILDVINPSDRELEAKIFQMIKKYQNMQTDAGNKLAWFFNAIYTRFFEIVENEGAEEPRSAVIERLEGDENQPTSSSNTVNQVEYKADYINPVLRQTITRIISVDSQYRDDKKNALATNFNFNLSDSLRDVLALRLHSIQIPKTWYTISKSYGANFFYLKGNSPGIDNGMFDYKISVPVGNYTASELIAKLNTSISYLKSKYTDASFGTTGFSYDTNSCKATFTIDYAKIYGETNYALSFPTWSYPVDGSNVGYFDTIPQILGYDSSNIPIDSINSVRSLSSDLSGNTLYKDDYDNFYITAQNKYFTIYNYNGYDSSNGQYIRMDSSYDYIMDLSSDFIYNTITIDSGILPTDASYSRYYIVDTFNSILQSHPDLSGAYIERVVVNDSHMDGCGNAYYKFVLPLNPFTTTNIKNQKTAVVFPQDNTIWLDSDSCFQFDASINEVSNVKAATTTKQSTYTIGSNVYFTAICDASGYNTGLNDVSINIPSGSYNLPTYIKKINDAIDASNADTNYFFDANPINRTSVGVTGFTLNAATNNKLRMRFYMNKEFTTDMYSFDVDGSLLESDFGFTSKDLSDAIYDVSGTVPDSKVTFTLNDGTLFKIKPLTTYGNASADSFDISLNCQNISNSVNGNAYTYGSNKTSIIGTDAAGVTDIFTYAIQTWTDPILGIQPLSQSTFSCSIDNDGSLNSILDISVNVVLNSQNYSIVFTDSESSWEKYLYLDSSYVLADLSYNNSGKKSYDASYSQYDGITTITDNMITLYDGSNNFFYIDPVNNGVADSTNANRITVTIDASANGTKYTIDNIVELMQAQFDATDSLMGSSISIDDSGYITTRINHSKIYNTSDYRIVFYDPYSFVRCFVGASSVKNTSWDTTIGWILGFRELTEYPLGVTYITTDENVDADETDMNKQYYGNTSSHYTYDESTNIANIIGDTTVSVNLYNYFMIVLDDYAQNHLNDGLVTMSAADKSLASASFANKGNFTVDPVTGDKIFVGTTSASGNKTTAKQIYAENQKLISRQPVKQNYSSGPFVQDVFAIIPLNVASLANGSVYVETSSSLNKQERIYFGPVNISRMNIKLVNDRGDTVDLNGSDWSCTLQCDQLYQQKSL